jgi:hypothetical protein
MITCRLALANCGAIIRGIHLHTHGRSLITSRRLLGGVFFWKEGD